MQKLLTFFSKNISIYAIFSDQSFNDTLINDIVSFEQLSPDVLILWVPYLLYLNRQAWANSVDPDQTLQNMASDQGLHCLTLF